MIRRSLAFLLMAGLAACQTAPLSVAEGECPAAVEARSAALAQQEQVREEFAREWRTGCEANYSAESCGADSATQEMLTQRDALVTRWWAEIAEPRIAAASLQCEGAGRT